MKFAFHYKSLDKFGKQQAMLEAVTKGAAVHGDEVIGVDHTGRVEGISNGIVLGIGKRSRHVFEHYRDDNRNMVYFDTGYTGCDYFRVSVNSFQPLEYIMGMDSPADRWKRLGIKVSSYKTGGEYILFDGASHKFVNWHRLGGDDFRTQWHSWGSQIVETIRYYSKKPIIYRPRPTTRLGFAPARPIPGTAYSKGPLLPEFERSSVVVSYGGSIGVDAAIYGIPHFAIGTSIARPISETIWGNIDNPRIPKDDERMQWLYNLAYCQYTMKEIASGKAWEHVRKHLHEASY